MDSLNNIPLAGDWKSTAGKLNDNFSKQDLRMTTIENTFVSNKGYFDSLSSLNTAFPSPKTGHTAYVHDGTSYKIANVSGGIWVMSAIEAPQPTADLNGYTLNGGSTKTLKNVEDEIVQLAGDMSMSFTQSDRYVHKLSGLLIVSTAYKASNYAFIGDKGVIISGYDSAGGDNSCLAAFYDKNKNFISAYTTGVEGVKIDLFIQPSEIPAGALYIRGTAKKNGIGYIKINISDGFTSLKSIIDNNVDSKEIMLPTSNITTLYKCRTLSDENSVSGRYLLSNGSTNTAVNFFYSREFIPINEGLEFTYIGGIRGNMACIIYASNKASIIKSFTASDFGGGDVKTFSFIAPKDSAYIRLSSFGNDMHLYASDSYSVKTPKNIVNKLENNPSIVEYDVKDKYRLQIKFRLNGDFNVEGKESTLLTDNLENGLKVRVIGSKTRNVNYVYEGTTDKCNCTMYNSAVKIGITKGGMSEYTVDFSTADYQNTPFLGEKLFSMRFTGEEGLINKDIAINVTDGIFYIKNGETIIKSYDLSLYPTVLSLCSAISSDITSGVLGDFEIIYHDVSHKPISDIASFEPVKMLAFFPSYDIPEQYKAFPMDIRAVDKKIHTLEIIRRSEGSTNNAMVVLDGIIKTPEPGYLHLPKIMATATLNNDANTTVFSFQATDNESKMSFPVVSHFYAHGIVNSFDETVTSDTNIGKLAEFADEMDKRGAVSISMQELAEYLMNGKELPRMSYILNFDDSRYEIFQEENVRRFFQKRAIKAHTSNVITMDNARYEIYSSADASFDGDYIVGDIYSNASISATYLGKSRLTGKSIFKLHGAKDYSILLPATLSKTTDNIKKCTITSLSSATIDEIPYSKYTRRPNDMNFVMAGYGFNMHLHDWKHGAALSTFNYNEFKDYAIEGIERFRHMFGSEPLFYVYPYGYITPMHAEVLRELGLRLGFTSGYFSTPYGINAIGMNRMLLPRTSIDINANMKTIGSSLDFYM